MVLRNLKHDLRIYMASNGWGTRLVGLRPRNRVLVIKKTSDIVIEGYPRCANTFSVVAFKQSQAGEVSIAHHLHAAGQILLAEHWGVPAVLLIREPLDAVTSLKIRHPVLDTRRCFRDYISFYGALLDVMNYPVIADFKSVTSDFGGIIQRVNERFNTEFSVFSGSEEAVSAVFSEIDSIRRAAGRSLSQIATPNAGKEAKKQEVRKAVLDEIDVDKLAEAEELYNYFKHLEA